MVRFPKQSVYLSIFILIIICVYGAAGPVCRAALPTDPPEQTELFPVYDLIKPNVTFWTNVFTQYTRAQGLVHDMENLSIIYEEIKLDPAETKEAALANKAIKKNALEKYSTILTTLSKGKIPETPMEKKWQACSRTKQNPRRSGRQRKDSGCKPD